ncbi:hypothetical protein ACVRWG_09415 [Streptococcus uberis]|uniref:hypothetical protein n=1 Tax=Streptococcus uberis TaxID=1349 RepID=UPI000542AF0F|nr:hypothetical protein [Streptococcus uberis]KHD40337.1 hypothetical protein NA32_06805 [Streptococcus hongkongensis]SQG45451.1 Uncharacterised protein [Streptococcus uberis]
MLEKLKRYFGLDELVKAEPTQTDSTLIELKTLKAENRRLKGIVDQKNALLQELSQENMAIGRDRQQMADIIARQQRLIDAYATLSS